VDVQADLWLTAEEQKVWRHLLAVQSRVLDRLDEELRLSHGLTLGDYGVLVHLSEAGADGLRMSELAVRSLLSRSGLTRRVDALARNGLVERRACPADGRGALAILTPLGAEKLSEAAPTHVAGVRRYLIDVVSDISALEEELSRISAALDS
jgi:DNA-binding MarR family transcriptional regulator